jgi:hypothetical protein
MDKKGEETMGLLGVLEVWMLKTKGLWYAVVLFSAGQRVA